MKNVRRLLIGNLSVITEALHQVIKIVHNLVKEFVHQLRPHHLRDINDDALAGADHPAGFGVGAAAAREYEDAGVGGLEGLQIGRKLTFGQWMVQSVGVLLEGPIRGVFVDVSPMEADAAVRRIPEIIDSQAFFLEAFDNSFVVWVSPAGGDVDVCHNTCY